MEYFADTPTFNESGLKAMNLLLWNGILAPAGTPAPIIRLLNTEIRKAAASQELIRAMGTQATSPTTSTPEDFAAFIKSEQKRFAVIVKESGARAD